MRESSSVVEWATAEVRVSERRVQLGSLAHACRAALVDLQRRWRWCCCCALSSGVMRLIRGTHKSRVVCAAAGSGAVEWCKRAQFGLRLSLSLSAALAGSALRLAERRALPAIKVCLGHEERSGEGAASNRCRRAALLKRAA